MSWTSTSWAFRFIATRFATVIRWMAYLQPACQTSRYHQAMSKQVFVHTPLVCSLQPRKCIAFCNFAEALLHCRGLLLLQMPHNVVTLLRPCCFFIFASLCPGECSIIDGRIGLGCRPQGALNPDLRQELLR